MYLVFDHLHGHALAPVDLTTISSQFGAGTTIVARGAIYHQCTSIQRVHTWDSAFAMVELRSNQPPKDRPRDEPAPAD